MSDLALPKSHYTHRVVAAAVRLVVEDGLPYRAASWHLWRDHRVSSRIALDMEREERMPQREKTTHTLHAARAKRKAA